MWWYSVNAKRGGRMKLEAWIKTTFMLGFAFVTTVNAQDHMGRKEVLILSVAKQIALAAEQQGCKVKCGGVIAILDDSGELMYLQRMDGSQIGSTKLAIAKARTAFLYKRTSQSFQDRVGKGESFLLNFPEMMPSGGGVPLFVEGKLVGAIGISGGAGGDDVVAQAGVDALAKIAGH
jgi:glc operon protein GlcG